MIGVFIDAFFKASQFKAKNSDEAKVGAVWTEICSSLAQKKAEEQSIIAQMMDGNAQAHEALDMIEKRRRDSKQKDQVDKGDRFSKLRQRRGMNAVPTHCVAIADNVSTKDSGLPFRVGDIMSFLQKDGEHVKGALLRRGMQIITPHRQAERPRGLVPGAAGGVCGC